MNIETRAREAAESLRSATLVDVEDGLARLHRTRQRRTAGKLVAAAAVVATAVGIVQVQRDQDDAAPARYGGPPVLLFAAGGGWEDPIAGDEEAQSYPGFVSADPATSRFLMADGWEHAEWTVYSPGSRTPVAVYPCRPYCTDAALGPGDDELTTREGDALIVTGPGHDVRRGLGDYFAPAWRHQVSADGGQVFPGVMAWAPDDRRIALARMASYQGRRSAELLVRDAASGEESVVYESTQPAPPGVPATADDWDPYGSPNIKAVAWSPDSSRLAFVAQRLPEDAQRDSALLFVLYVADLDSGELEEIDQVATCPAAQRFRDLACYEYASLAWHPGGERLTVLSPGRLATYDRHGELVGSQETMRRGAIVWLGSE